MTSMRWPATIRCMGAAAKVSRPETARGEPRITSLAPAPGRHRLQPREEFAAGQIKHGGNAIDRVQGRLLQAVFHALDETRVQLGAPAQLQPTHAGLLAQAEQQAAEALRERVGRRGAHEQVRESLEYSRARSGTGVGFPT